MRLTRSLQLSLSLFFLLSGIFWLTYRGLDVNVDALYLFDGAESLVRRGTLDISLTFDRLNNDRGWDRVLLPIPQEPLQPILAAPLFWIAEQVPEIGLMHTVWTFNIFITALTGVLVFHAAAPLTSNVTAAWLTGLAYGLTTTAWPFSQTFFREPLAGLFLLLAFVGLMRLGGGSVSRRGRVWAFLTVIGAAGAVMLTKFAMALVLPALALVLLRTDWYRSRTVALAAAGVVGLAALLFLIGEVASIDRLRWVYWESQLPAFEWHHLIESFLGYLISPGRSLFLYAPMLLLSLVGGVMLVRQGKGLFVAAILGAALLVPFIYGIGRGGVWWGANGWGPRHMIPVMPLLALPLTPVFAALLQPGARAWARLGTLGLAALSVFVQLLGVLVWLYRHYDWLQAEGKHVWHEGMWVWRWSPIPGHLRFLDLGAPDLAWQAVGWGLPAVLTLLVIAGAGALAVSGRPTLRLALSVALPPLLLISLGSGLYSLRDDPRYSDNPDINALIDRMNTQMSRDDAVFIVPVNFHKAMMNWLKGPSLVVMLPYAPGENFNPQTDAAMRDQPPEALLPFRSTDVMDWGIDRYTTVWGVFNSGPETPDELRVTERYLLERTYPFDETAINGTHRAAAYDTRAHTEPEAADAPIDFGGQLTLISAAGPALGAPLAPGDVVPVSLYWEAPQPPGTDYLISLQIGQDGQPPVVQYDGLPLNGFGTTSTWTPGTRYSGHYGLALPVDLTPGPYDLRLIVYTYPDLTRLPVGDSDLAVLDQLRVE